MPPPLLVLFCSAIALGAAEDPLWLRYTPVLDAPLRASYLAAGLGGPVRLSHVPRETDSDAKTELQLRVVEKELTRGISAMLRGSPAVGHAASALHVQTPQLPPQLPPPPLTVTVDPNRLSAVLGSEGYRILPSSPEGSGERSAGRGSGMAVEAATASGAMYGAFRLLSYMQRRVPLPTAPTDSVPATRLRHWDLWDQMSGSVTRGFSGNSIVWPYARYADDSPPPRTKLFLVPCNATDRYQQWEGTTLHHQDTDNNNNSSSNSSNTSSPAPPSTIVNRGSGGCLGTAQCDPVQAVGSSQCHTSSPSTATWTYNASNFTLALSHAGEPGPCSHAMPGACLDLNGGSGPDIDLWECHPEVCYYIFQSIYSIYVQCQDVATCLLTS